MTDEQIKLAPGDLVFIYRYAGRTQLSLCMTLYADGDDLMVCVSVRDSKLTWIWHKQDKEDVISRVN